VQHRPAVVLLHLDIRNCSPSPLGYYPAPGSADSSEPLLRAGSASSAMLEPCKPEEQCAAAAVDTWDSYILRHWGRNTAVE